MKISVVIPTYNDHVWLSRAIDSVLNQTYKPHEIIVVDDGSQTGDAQSIVEKNFNAYRNSIKFYRKNNGGAASARNYGVEKASGEFVGFLDADDYWLENNLKIKAKLIDSCGYDYFGIYSNFEYSNNGKPARFISIDGKLNPDDIGKINCYPGGVHCYIIRRETILNIGGFDEGLPINEDFDLILRMIQAGHKGKGTSEVGFVRNMRYGSLTRNDDLFAKYEKNAKFMSKAKSNGYFSKSEYMRREKNNYLALAKNLFKANKGKKYVLRALNCAFLKSSPSNAREVSAYIYMYYLKIVAGH